MTKIINKTSDIKNSNLVYIVEKIGDIEKIEDLKLDEKIIKKITEELKEEKNIVLNFFIWNFHFENLYIMIYSKKEWKTLVDFLSEEFPKLPRKLTISSNNDKNLLDLVNSCILSRYKFTKYKTVDDKKDKINVLVDKENEKIVEERLETIENIILARNLWETPACDLTPESFANIIKKTKWKNTKVKILSPKNIEKKGLWLLHSVWKWSENKPYMVILERIVDKNVPTYWFVWKWIVFDSWWINLKPTDYLFDMKWDMCWAATTYCTMKELDKKDLNVNIIACIPLAENSLSWNAYRPSDIIKSYSWKTVNITNTDAEWRLILADWISYISKNYKLDNLMTIATLTWAVMVALWFRYAWIMWTDRTIINILLKNSKKDVEKYFELPFDDYYIEKSKSEIADYDNWTKWISTWSTMWGAFLYNFLENKEKYTHIDIAWVALNSYEPYSYVNKWMTWFWVDSLSKLFLNL